MWDFMVFLVTGTNTISQARTRGATVLVSGESILEYKRSVLEFEKSQYSPVRLEQAMLVYSSLLHVYGTWLMLYIFLSNTLLVCYKFKGLPVCDDASNSERTSYHNS